MVIMPTKYEIEHHDDEIISVLHDGTITWDKLQEIKNLIWGCDAVAIEIYPAAADVINTTNQRHLWRVPDGMIVPDLDGGWPDA